MISVSRLGDANVMGPSYVQVGDADDLMFQVAQGLLVCSKDGCWGLHLVHILIFEEPEL